MSKILRVNIKWPPFKKLSNCIERNYNLGLHIEICIYNLFIISTRIINEQLRTFKSNFFKTTHWFIIKFWTV